MTVPLERLVGVAEIAERLGIPKQNIYRWIERRTATHFPLPIKELVMGNLYDLAMVEAWYQRWTSTRRRREIR